MFDLASRLGFVISSPGYHELLHYVAQSQDPEPHVRLLNYLCHLPGHVVSSRDVAACLRRHIATLKRALLVEQVKVVSNATNRTETSKTNRTNFGPAKKKWAIH